MIIRKYEEKDILLHLIHTVNGIINFIVKK
jgi:hypothetical protein